MNCREFRQKHDAYIDDTLSGVELEAMAHHRRLCETCSRRDTRVRRALLVARNLPTIEPSVEFAARLHARLRAERATRQLSAPWLPPATPHERPTMRGTYTIIAAGVLAAAGLASAVSLSASRDRILRLAPVVASRPELEPGAAVTAPTMIAAMPAGMPLWPAVFVAQQAPWHFASDVAGR